MVRTNGGPPMTTATFAKRNYNRGARPLALPSMYASDRHLISLHGTREMELARVNKENSNTFTPIPKKTAQKCRFLGFCVALLWAERVHVTKRGRGGGTVFPFFADPAHPLSARRLPKRPSRWFPCFSHWNHTLCGVRARALSPASLKAPLACNSPPSPDAPRLLPVPSPLPPPTTYTLHTFPHYIISLRHPKDRNLQLAQVFSTRSTLF